MSEQFVLGSGTKAWGAWSRPSEAVSEVGSISSQDAGASRWSNSLVFPLYAVFASAFLLAVHFFIGLLLNRRKPSKPTKVPTSFDGQSKIKTHVEQLGGGAIFGYMVLRTLISLTLLGLSVASIASGLSKNGFLENVSLCSAFGYSSVLGLLSLITKRHWSRQLVRHVNAIHLVVLIVYAYRDLYPLTIFGKTPEDADEGSLLWVRIGLLGVVAIVIPLVIPRQYVPYDPETPEAPSPEQTASLLSLVLYNFMNSIVFKAWKVEKLDQQDLPPIADFDRARNLRESKFPFLDPMKIKRRNLFFSLMAAFRTDYATLFTTLILRAIFGFTTPVAVNGLLMYVEARTKGEEVSTKPWVWVLALFLGPTIESLTWDWYLFISTRALVQTQSVLTQLVFEHALRIRMKSETNEDNQASPDTPATPVPESASQVSDSDNDGSSSENVTLHAEDTDTQGDGSSTVAGNSRTPNDRSSSSGSIKKGEAAPQSSPAPTSASTPADKESKSKAANLVGRMNNLVTSDLTSIVEAKDFGMLIVYTPLQIVLCIVFLHMILGWSAFVGLAVIIIMFPLPGYLTKLVQKAQKDKMKKTDARVETVTETMNVLRMVKMFGWERLINDRIAEKREEELTYIRRMRLLNLLVDTTNYTIPIITMLATFSTYVCLLLPCPRNLFIPDIFFRRQLHMCLYVLNQAVAAKVSLERITDFLYNTELLDTYRQSSNGKLEEVPTSTTASEGTQDIGFRNATFTWSNDSEDGTMTPSRRRFRLQVEDELLFKRGCINLIVGPTGCGKTSMLMALLSEMHFVPMNPDSWYNLPRDKGVAYAAQESWVQNATIKENIVFRSEFDEERYKKVLYQCALERDLSLFEAGDATEVGEKGLTLSGGQKARVTLARAVYSDAEIILLDDVLAALDVHTSKWIIDKCFKGDLIKGRTVLLVTHNIVLTQPIAGFVVSLKDGKVASQGTVSDALVRNHSLAIEARQEEQELHIAEETIDPAAPTTDAPKSDGKLILAEEVETGHVGWPALRLFIKALGGNHTVIFFVGFLGLLLLSEFGEIIQTWFMGYWAEQYEKSESGQVNVPYYLTIYVLILLFGIITYSIAFVVYLFGSLRSSRSIHKQLVTSILGTTLRWLDTTPTSRVITRCTKDMNDVDRQVPMMFSNLLHYSLSLLEKFAAVIFYTPVFAIPGLVVALLGGSLGQVYIRAQLPIKRLQSNAKAPVLGHFGAAIAGITSIRAYGVQESFRKDTLKYIDSFTQSSRLVWNLNRWIGVRTNTLANIFSAGLAAYLVYFGQHSSSTIGFSLNMAVAFSSGILMWIRIANIFETQANSLERINGYVNIEQEPKSSDDRVPPAHWPSSGELYVDKLSARYSPDGPQVLRDISFRVGSGERIGVVGRTGSGKSSLMLSLLRCIYTDGEVYYDGIPTASINLENLRTNITIIPQVPELLSGTVRRNLDPFDQYDDAVLNDALRSAGLYSIQSEEESNRITLDSAISSGGSNFSVGQRQILALARAMVRGSKLLILDEATSAIDYKTDSIIQSSLRHELGGDVTLITVAHRLQTIMDADKIMVLDAGNIVEFDKPSVLLHNPDGKLRALVDESADKDPTGQRRASNSHGRLPSIKENVNELGGPVTVAYLAARSVLSVVLLGISVSLLLNEKETPQDHGSTSEIGLSACITFTYSSILDALALFMTRRRSKVLTRHADIVLLVTFVIYACRDLYPLGTTDRKPLDSAEGSLLWAKIALLAIASVVIPLAMPRPYIPVNPLKPRKPTAEQTASLSSLATYSFLDSFLFKGARTEKLTTADLPQLADYDDAEHLKEIALPYLDPMRVQRRNLFWSLSRVFWKEYIWMTLALVLQAATWFARPIAVNELLRYLELDGHGITIRPFMWIILMFFGPMIEAMSMEWYTFISSRTFVRIEAILTQAIYEHILRIRVIAETSTTEAQSSTSDFGTKDNASTPKSNSSNLVGKLNNLASSDLQSILGASNFFRLFVFYPLQIVDDIANVVPEYSAFIGLATIIVLIPLPGILARFVQQAQLAKMQRTDARVQTVTETLNILRMIKMFGWESLMNERISQKREEELVYIKRARIVDLAGALVNFTIPLLTMLATYATQHLRMLLFDLTDIMRAKVSLDRVTDFLYNTELLDEFSESQTVTLSDSNDNTEIGFCNATFTWASGSSHTNSQRHFQLKVEGELLFKKGCINLILGPTGSGKTSLLHALLSEMHFIPSSSDSWYYLPTRNGVAYASQESWIQNATIKDNILLASDFDEERYNKVIYQCALERDLSLFEAGDETEVGERGLTLSGGQKARLTLARAVYSRAKIVLLDDVLAALDVHTSKWVVEKCFQGDLMQGRTILLVTHNLALTQPIAGFVVSMKEGRVVSQGSVSDALVQNRALVDELHSSEKKLAESDEQADNDSETPTEIKKPSGKLIAEEDVEIGHVAWSSIKLYLNGLGVISAIAFFFFTALSEALGIVQVWFLGVWSDQYQTSRSDQVNDGYYLSILVLLLFLVLVTFSVAFTVLIFGAMRSSRIIHQKLVGAVLGTTFRWLDITPTSRVIARCTRDMLGIDSMIPAVVQRFTQHTLMLLGKLLTVVYLTLTFLGPGIIVALLGIGLGRIYIKTQLSVKRLHSNANAPVLGHFSATIMGLTSIRAYGVQEVFKSVSLSHINDYSRPARILYTLRNWVDIRTDVLNCLFGVLLATYLVYFTQRNSSTTGFTLSMGVGFSSGILSWIWMYFLFEMQSNSLERVNSYISIEQEPKPTKEGVPPAYWPSNGEIRVEKLAARYSPDGPKVLQNISFNITSGERIGVVGRTGSGKSSLMLSLLRCIYTDGDVYYDGIKTNSINLEDLRRNITIIPQDPALLSGTVRTNLDPFDQYDDAILNDALRSAGLDSIQSEEEKDRIKLDTTIAAGGGNMSVGQRQILALARAIVPTSAIDYKTDAVIQSSLRHELQGNVTVITVAHRLQTIMDADKIMVLDAGKIVEFDRPKELLEKVDGKFRGLVDESVDKETLYEMAGFKNSS
ncbi:P-loop containing nucleoside triphosphate hydrolase protein [Dendrothele bispora CBS 962.96]|uniref:P-loop containing nucleoside triphosphate hydrolase protein n=1 Tax=Dendrothele bispora (strain CBS 962.96) TaxID=1314807 RepID=A0A4S8MUN7_DENBC|nr:P-loop containing nucleoside triphosphate hydrolase protein [Dendrothele bispora CBS 962.96]